MKKIFLGFLFVFLDFNLNAGNSTIGLIPDFLGFIFLVKGLQELSHESKRFVRMRPYAIGMAVYSGILYVMDLLGMSAALGWAGVILGIIATILILYISYNIIMGVKEIEANRNANLNGENLYSTWIPMAIMQVVTYVTIVAPAISIICIIVSFVLAIVFLVQLNRTKNAYEVL